MPLSDLFAAVRWWLALMIVGLAVTPLAFVLFRRLADRGYAFVKMLGLLLVGYLFWILGTFGFLGNNAGGIIVALLLATGLSLWLYRRFTGSELVPEQEGATRRHWLQPLFAWHRGNLRQVLLTEAVFLAIFALWVWVRAQNPAIAATEKPMEFAFLNAIGRSPTFPPVDPWLSGFAISYYYFGYVMTSLIARLAFVSEPVAFNLGIAWLVAGTATGAFGLVYNLLAAEGSRRVARVLALVAALALPVAGNLVIGAEIAYANNIGSPGLWEWLDVRELNQPQLTGTTTPRYETSSWWWWRSSRPIREYHLSGRPEDGLEPIAEFPGFSFVLGDMHPHVLALPFAFLSLAVAFVWWREAAAWPVSKRGWRAWRDLRPHQYLLWGVTALLLGGLSFLNTWDVLIHLFVIIGALALGRWRAEGWHNGIISSALTWALLLILPAFVLYLPFYLGFRSQAGAPYLLPMLMRPTRLVQFLLIFGMPLWAITLFLLALVARQRFRYWRQGLRAALLLLAGLLALMLLFLLIIALSPESAGRITALAGELGLSLPPHPAQPLALGWSITALAAVLPGLIVARLALPGLVLFLITLVGLIVMIWHEIIPTPTEDAVPEERQSMPRTLPFALLLLVTGALLTLGPEFVYLRDNFGVRLNTIFKFYYQAWVLFGVGALYALGYLWQARPAMRATRAVATVGYALALAIALLFPYYGVRSRAIEYRGPTTAETRQPPTLNGLAQVMTFNPDEYAAITWLRENATGTPTVLEAVGGQYSNFGRVSANTGLPTVLGWAGHQYQWRGNTPEPAVRDPAVREIYTQPSLEAAAELLDRYGIQYIFVGGLERETYGSQGLEKFSEQLEPAFSSGGVTIYRWQPRS